MSEEELRHCVARALGGSVVRFDVVNEILEVTVRSNPEFSVRTQESGKDSFLFFRYRLEVDPVAGAPQQAVLARVASILEAMWRTGAAAIASCEYEHLLPCNAARADT